MKSLPNERFSIVNQSLRSDLLKEVDFSTLAGIASPKCLIFKQSFSSTITVGYYTNITRLVTNLVLSGYDYFMKYVRNFSEYYGIQIPLEKVLEENYSCTFNKLAVYDCNISTLLEVLIKNEQELVDFIKLLKLTRPKNMTKTFSKFKDIENSGDKMYISYIEIDNSEFGREPVLYSIDNQAVLGSFNLELPYNSPSYYNNIVEECSYKIDSLSLDFILNSVINDFKEANDNIFELEHYNFLSFTMPLLFSFAYDVVFERMKRLVL